MGNGDCRAQTVAVAGSNIAVRGVRLEHVGYEVMAPMKTFGVWILIVPTAIVNRNLHFGWIAVVHAIAAAIVFRSIEILRIVNVWVVIEAVAISRCGCTTPILSIGIRAACAATVVEWTLQIRRTAGCATRASAAIAIDAIICHTDAGERTAEGSRADQAVHGLA